MWRQAPDSVPTTSSPDSGRRYGRRLYGDRPAPEAPGAIKLLSPDLTGSQPRARLQHTDNVEAYHLSLKGRHTFFRRTAGAMAQSKRFFEQALA
ncbi:MAG: hypothetical protein ABGY72_21975 [bacterium]